MRTLLGAKGFDSSITCLRSLIECSAAPLQLFVHEDGTLADNHREQLLSLAPGVSLVGRPTADSIVLPHLERYPKCRAARASGPLFLKLFDISLMAEKYLSYCDSDVFFLRRYRGVFRPPARGYAFMTDACNAYSVRPWRVWPTGRIRLGGRVNTGLIVGPAGLDLDFIEWVLGVLATDAAFARRPYWAEQTCWAAIAARGEFQLFCPRQVILASDTMASYNAKTVAIHFVSTYRDRLAGFKDSPRAVNEPPQEIGKFAGRGVSTLGLLWTDFKRKLSRPVRGHMYMIRG